MTDDIIRPRSPSSERAVVPRPSGENDRGGPAAQQLDDDQVDQMDHAAVPAGAAGGTPAPPPLAKPKHPMWTDFRELHMMRQIGPGLRDWRHGGGALLQILGRGVFPGVATVALSRVMLQAQAVAGSVQYNTGCSFHSIVNGKIGHREHQDRAS